MILYILFIIVLFFIIFNKINNGVEGFTQDRTNKNTIENNKCLLVYYGGSFREGNIGTTISDTKYGYESQKHASITHAKLKRLLNKNGYQTDILINTRHTEYKDDLMNWYNPFNIILNNIPKRIHGKDYMIQSCIQNINKLDKEEYKFILFIRIDLFLKPDFYKILNTESNKIMFLANNYDPKLCINFTKKNNPKIVDLIMFIPKKYYYILDSKFILNHDSWDYLKTQYKLKDNDISFMTNKMFDSNSMIDFNPYYLMSSRKENINNHTTELFNINSPIKKCNRYSEITQQYMSNPTQKYINKYNNFYIN